MDLGWEKVQNWKCLFVHRKQGLLLSVHVGDISMVQTQGKLHAKTVARFHDMERHAQKMRGKILRIGKRRKQLYKVSSPFLNDHNYKKDELRSVGELSDVCPQIVLQFLYLARFGRPNILCTVSKLARSVKKWLRACDRRQARLIFSSHHTSDYRQYLRQCCSIRRHNHFPSDGFHPR